ncbi:hypothetical protein QOT17_013686 [Balamuthia mandrillaris]
MSEGLVVFFFCLGVGRKKKKQRKKEEARGRESERKEERGFTCRDLRGHKRISAGSRGPTLIHRFAFWALMGGRAAAEGRPCGRDGTTNGVVLSGGGGRKWWRKVHPSLFFAIVFFFWL